MEKPVQGKYPPDPFGLGFLADGKLNVVSPEEHAKRVLERNAEESEGEPEEEGPEREDGADL